jgi:Family of unknown function (DUF6325)
MGPVSFIAAGFGPDARFEGRIVELLRRFEESGALRVVDVLFVRRVPGSDELDVRPGIPGRPTVVSQDDVDEVAGALAPGQAAGLLLIEHLWQEQLLDAIAETGGAVLRQGALDDAQVSALMQEG